MIQMFCTNIWFRGWPCVAFVMGSFTHQFIATCIFKSWWPCRQTSKIVTGLSASAHATCSCCSLSVVEVIYQTLTLVFDHISKHQEWKLKNEVQSSVWKCVQRQVRLFDSRLLKHIGTSGENEGESLANLGCILLGLFRNRNSWNDQNNPSFSGLS